MPEERSPAFQFYPRDFLADENVMRMGAAERGIYISLLCTCWMAGSIPADLEELAPMLPRVTLRELTAAWRIVGRCFIPHPTRTDRLVNGRLERERAKQAEFREKASQAGRKGGLAKANAKRTSSERLAEGVAESSSASASADATLPDGSSATGAHDASPLDGDAPTTPVSPAADLIAWFTTAGIAAGAIPGHFELLRRSPAPADVIAANALLETWSREAIESRARLLFARKLDRHHPRGRMTGVPSVAILAEWWDSIEPVAPSGARPAPPPGSAEERYSQPHLRAI